MIWKNKLTVKWILTKQNAINAWYYYVSDINLKELYKISLKLHYLYGENNIESLN